MVHQIPHRHWFLLDCYTAFRLPGKGQSLTSHTGSKDHIVIRSLLEGNPSSDVSISITRKSPPKNSWPMKIFLLTILPANHSHAHSGLWQALSLEGEQVQQAMIQLSQYEISPVLSSPLAVLRMHAKQKTPALLTQGFISAKVHPPRQPQIRMIAYLWHLLQSNCKRMNKMNSNKANAWWRCTH